MQCLPLTDMRDKKIMCDRNARDFSSFLCLVSLRNLFTQHDSSSRNGEPTGSLGDADTQLGPVTYSHPLARAVYFQFIFEFY